MPPFPASVALGILPDAASSRNQRAASASRRMTRRLSRALAVLGTSLLPPALVAQSVVVPSTGATASTGSVLNNMVREVNNPRTYMQGIPAAELAAIPVGAVITGISARIGHTASNATYPPASGNASWSTYDISIGPAIPPASWTGSFQSNFASPPTVVRSGPMVIESGAFVMSPGISSPQVHPWSTFHWDFQRAYVYTGGDLAILYTNPGSQSTASVWLDAVTTSPTTPYRAFATTGYQAASGTTTTFTVIRLHYGYGTGCPAAPRTPMLVQTNDVTGGGAVTFAAGNAASGAAIAYAFGPVQATVPLWNGCTLLLAPATTVAATTSPLGRHRLALTVPANILGIAYVQAFGLDGTAPGGLAASNATTLTVRP